MNQQNKYILLAILISIVSFSLNARGKMLLSLEDAIRIANDSSLSAFRNRNLYASGYWEWRTFKANRLPHLSLEVTPAQYYRYITQRYDSYQDIDVFRSQQMYLASAGLNVTQNVDFLGGSLFVESDFEYLRNFGEYQNNQFSTVPIRLGYRQNLLGYNPLKWEKKIEPMKYEKAKLEFIYNMETVSEQTVEYFFDLALAQTELKLAEQNRASSDTLLSIGEKRFKIASITETDLLTLRLDKVNAENSIENARISVKKAQLALASYLGLDSETEIQVAIPSKPFISGVSEIEAVNRARANNPSLMAKKQSVMESKRDVSKLKIESLFNASFIASVGYNQVANKFADGYRHPLRQDIVSVSLSIPLVDWGVRKGKYNVALNNLNLAQIAVKQEEQSLEQDVMITVRDLESRQRLVVSASDALDLAERAYAQTQKRFIIGQADMNSLTLSNSRKQEANRNYISSLKNCWLSIYKIRKLTLYDFSINQPIELQFDSTLGTK